MANYTSVDATQEIPCTLFTENGDGKRTDQGNCATKSCTRCGAKGPFYKQASRKDGLRSHCNACVNTANRAWYEANRDKEAAKSKEWYEANRDKAAAKYREWYEANRERKDFTTKAWRQANRERVREQGRLLEEANKEKRAAMHREWYRANRERFASKARAWQVANRDIRVILSHNRRAKENGNGGRYTRSEWNALLNATGNRCLACGVSGVKLTVDHVVPISRGGSNSIDNLQPLCKACNSSKGTKTVDYRTSTVE